VGRTEETYGEDPYLAGQIGVAMVKGLQGEDLTRDDAIVAQPKHFAVHGIPESGSNTSPVSVENGKPGRVSCMCLRRLFEKGRSRGHARISRARRHPLHQ